jgi:cytochrome c oxidase cbb3-type subunit 3
MTRKLFAGVVFALLLANSLVLAQTRFTEVEKGKRLYQRNCLRCHGTALDGKGPEAASLTVPPANFRAYLSRLKDDAEFEKTIKQGKQFLGMHSWDDALTDKQVGELIAYIRSAAPQLEVTP